jgi:hypothetical protein
MRDGFRVLEWSRTVSVSSYNVFMSLYNPELAEEIQRQASDGLHAVSSLEGQTEDDGLHSILETARACFNDVVRVLAALSEDHGTGYEAHMLKSAELLLGRAREHVNTVRNVLRGYGHKVVSRECRFLPQNYPIKRTLEAGP